jgi:hypothetical protein
MKLLRKDVLKWIRALQSGQYKKGTGKLVSNNGTKFCCLGVWADMHGATWEEKRIWNGTVECLVPVLKGRKTATVEQNNNGSYLHDPKLAKGLDMSMQRELATANDDSTQGFKPVIAYIKKEVLPLAK